VEAKLKIIEITDIPWEQRWKALTEEAQTQLGVQITAETKIAQKENFLEILKQVLESDADIFCVSDNFSVDVLSLVQQTTHQATMAGACDFFVKEKGGWWPRVLLTESFMRTISHNLGQLDLDSYALVIGGTGFSKLVVGALVKLGYSKINIAEQSAEIGNALISEMSKRYYQVQFEFIPFQTVTTLPGVHSLVVNTSHLTLENVLLDELYFFNFLKSGGAVVDLNIIPPVTPLIEEARIWGARHLSGDYVLAQLDAQLLDQRLAKKMDIEKYRMALRANADAVPFDISPFLKRFRDRGT
jgi:shikimate 5-dehydrogenase